MSESTMVVEFLLFIRKVRYWQVDREETNGRAVGIFMTLRHRALLHISSLKSSLSYGCIRELGFCRTLGLFEVRAA